MSVCNMRDHTLVKTAELLIVTRKLYIILLASLQMSLQEKKKKVQFLIPLNAITSHAKILFLAWLLPVHLSITHPASPSLDECWLRPAQQLPSSSRTSLHR